MDNEISTNTKSSWTTLVPWIIVSVTLLSVSIVVGFSLYILWKKWQSYRHDSYNSNQEIKAELIKLAPKDYEMPIVSLVSVTPNSTKSLSQDPMGMELTPITINTTPLSTAASQVVGPIGSSSITLNRTSAWLEDSVTTSISTSAMGNASFSSVMENTQVKHEQSKRPSISSSSRSQFAKMAQNKCPDIQEVEATEQFVSIGGGGGVGVGGSGVGLIGGSGADAGIAVDNDENTMGEIVDESLGEGNDEGLGQIHVIISYNYAQRLLGLHLIEAFDLVPKDLNGKSDPFVKICLLPEKRLKHKSKTISRSLYPKWDQKFWFPNLTTEQLFTNCLHIQVKDRDFIGKNDLIGEINIPLLTLHIDEPVGDEIKTQELWKYLRLSQSSKKYVGELLLSLCYNPYTTKLNINIIRAKNLKAMDRTNLSDPFCYILLKGTNGKVYDSRKTSVKSATLFPVWNEAFNFSLTANQMTDIYIDIKVSDKDRLGHDTIGKIRLGNNSRPQQLGHWMKMLNKPREVISQWHTLQR